MGLDWRYVLPTSIAIVILINIGAENDGAEGGMNALGMDLSYMGVRTIWANDLGRLLVPLGRFCMSFSNFTNGNH